MENKVIDIAFDTRKYILNICRAVLNDQYDLEQACEEIYNKWNLAYFPIDDNYYIFSNISSQIGDLNFNYINDKSTDEEISEIRNRIYKYVFKSSSIIKSTCQDLIDKYAI